MATYYVASDAAGGGDGSQGDPWTLDEANTNAPKKSLILIQPGTYLRSTTWSVDSGSIWNYRRWLANGSVTIRADAALSTLCEMGDAYSQILDGIDFDGNDQVTELIGYSNNVPNTLANCLLRNAQTAIQESRNRADLFRCEITGMSSHGLKNFRGSVTECHIHGNSGWGIEASEYVYSNVNRCVVYGNGSGGVYSRENICDGCVVTDNGGNGIAVPYWNGSAVRCISQNNTGTDLSLSDFRGFMSDNFFAGSIDGVSDSNFAQNNMTLTADVFVDSANGDFRLTAYGKSFPGIRAIMAGLVNVPGIITNSLAELMGGASPSFVSSPFIPGGLY